jgi:PAS domain-containing protein
MEFLRWLLFSDGFMPHGYCYLWNPGLVWLHVMSDSLITLAYLSIPITLIYFVRKRRDLPFHWMFICFGTFIVACGATHAMEIWNLWHAAYWLAGGVKAVTAVASVLTAILLTQLVPQALALPSATALVEANAALERQIAERKQAEEALRRSEEKYRRFFTSNLAATFVCEPQGQILECNPAYARMLGFDSVANWNRIAFLSPFFGDRQPGRFYSSSEFPSTRISPQRKGHSQYSYEAASLSGVQ